MAWAARDTGDGGVLWRERPVSGERWLVGLVVEENWRWGVGEAKGSFALLVRVGWCGVRQRIHAVQGGFRRVSFSAAVGFFWLCEREWGLFVFHSIWPFYSLPCGGRTQGGITDKDKHGKERDSGVFWSGG